MRCGDLHVIRNDQTGEIPARSHDDYAPRTVNPQGHETSNRDVAYCKAHFRSYNLTTKTYLGMDGARHTCP